MISLLEKEARDPVEVLRAKLKDSSETSLLNSQLLQEIKHDYVRKQDSTKGQLDSFVQAHVDEIERASTLLEMEDTVTQIVRNFDTLHQNCRKMNDELGEKKLSSGISIARRNLKELENQMVFYDELPSKVQELDQTLDERLSEIVNVYTKWQTLDDWRQKMLQELRACASDKTDELGSSKAQARILASMAPRLDAVEGLHKKIMSEVWGCMDHCVQVAQFNKKRLMDAFQVLELMEKRRRRFVETKKDYLDNTIQVVSEMQTPFSERCKTEISSHLTKKANEMFRAAEKDAESNKKQKPLDAVLDAANQLLMDLEGVQSDVVACFPTEIDVMYVFTSTYNILLENEISKQCSHPDVGIAERLQLVQWIEYYNTEIIKYKRARASIVLEQTAQMLMSLYLDQIQGQIHMWVTNVWKRDEEHVIGLHGELQTTRPNDIMNILKSQISIGQEWLTGRLVGRVVTQCLEALMDQLKTRYDSIAQRVAELDIESLCSFINDTDVLQAKCPELVEEISFAERDATEKEAFDHSVGDGLDATSTEIVKLAAATCELLVGKIFSEIEHDTIRLWLSKKWDEGDAVMVMETFLATIADYYNDLKHWISGTFFFSKIVRQCLDRCVKEYVKRLLIRTHCFPSPQAAATAVENDMKNMVAFFMTYAPDLRRTGLRTDADIKKEFATLQFIADALKGTAPEIVPDEHREAVQHVRKLLRTTSTQEAAVTNEKSTKKKKDKPVKEKEKTKDKEKKPKKEKDKGKERDKGKEKAVSAAVATRSASAREGSFPEPDADGAFEVQKLNMADFLGSSPKDQRVFEMMPRVRMPLLPLMALLAFICVALLATADAFRTAVLLESNDVQQTHSKFFQLLTKRGHELSYFVNDPELVLEEYGVRQFDNLVIFSPQKKLGKLTKADLLHFVEQGGNVLLSSNAKLTKLQRDFALECGVEFEKKGNLVIDHVNPIADGSDIFNSVIAASDFVNAERVVGTTLADGNNSKNKKPVAFTGVGLSLEPNNILGFHVLTAPVTAYSTNPVKEITAKVVENDLLFGNEIGLVTAIQGRNNARMVFSGSLELFSDKFFTDAFSNEPFSDAVTKWAFQESGVLRMTNIAHKRADGRRPDKMLKDSKRPDLPITLYPDAEIARDSLVYRVKDNLTYSCDVHELKDGKWVPFKAADMQLEFVMLDAYVRKTLTHDNNGHFSVTFEAPDAYGIFQFRVLYRRLGVSTLYTTKQVSLRPYKHDEYERFIPAAYPYYTSAFSMMAGVFVFSVFFLFYQEKK